MIIDSLDEIRDADIRGVLCYGGRGFVKDKIEELQWMYSNTICD